MKLTVAISKVNDGNMLIKSDKSNLEVIKNRKKFLEKNKIDINKTTRISTKYEGADFCRYLEVDKEQYGAGMFDGEVATSDALVTKKADHALFLPIADCVGAVIFDPINNILMLSHLGRHALEKNGAFESVIYFVNRYNCKPKNLLVWLSPAPGADSYPVYAFNNRSLKDVVFEQLYSAGVLKNQITDDTADTSNDIDYFSHSKYLKGNQPNDDRFAIVAVMRNK
jgi:copper oxidase (laccase) domain-containing protein